MSAPRVRFAPAPSGWLHVGSVRTALYNWLHARGNGGTFLFRIEDTDAERATDESMRSMLAAMGWLGIEPDEGVTLRDDGQVTEVGDHGPYRQSLRKDLHAAVARRLQEAGHLYEDDRTPDELGEWRKQRQQDELPPIVKRSTVPEPTGDRPVTLRLALPETGSITVHDEVRGEVTWQWATQSDPVLVRSNGSVTYPLANSTDDLAQGITLVCRGEDLLSVTPRQVFLYDLLLGEGLLDDALEEVGLPAREDDWGAPGAFAHLSMVVGEDRKKLSKRHGSVAIQSFAARGYLPEVMVNYIALLGWAPEDGSERLTVDELIETFDLSRVGKTAAMFDTDKLTAFNGERIRDLSTDELADRLLPYLDGSWPAVTEDPATEEETEVAVEPIIDRPPTDEQRATVEGLVPLVQERMQRLDEVRDYAAPFFTDELEIDEDQAAKVLRKAGAVEALHGAQRVLADCEWETDTLEEVLRGLADDLGMGFGKVAQPVRVAVTGTTVSPPLFETIELLGRDESVARLESAIPVFERHAPRPG